MSFLYLFTVPIFAHISTYLFSTLFSFCITEKIIYLLICISINKNVKQKLEKKAHAYDKKFLKITLSEITNILSIEKKGLAVVQTRSPSGTQKITSD